MQKKLMPPLSSTTLVLAGALALAAGFGAVTHFATSGRGPTLPVAAAVAATSDTAGTAPQRVKATGQLGPGRGTLLISLQAAAGAKLTDGAPLRVSARGEHLEFPETVKRKLRTAELPVRLPVVVTDGATGPAEVDLSYYTCQVDDQASCKPVKARVVVDLDLTGDAPGGEAHFTYKSPG